MKVNILFTTCFGLGKLPFAPGTWGSLPPVILYQSLAYIISSRIIPFWIHPLVHISLIIFGSWICIWFCPSVIQETGNKDPKSVVSDELAGQALTMLIISLKMPDNICNTAVLGFALFRLFDIVKPWPCRKLEKLPLGWGILADDLMAGIYAGILSLILIHLIPGCFA